MFFDRFWKDFRIVNLSKIGKKIDGQIIQKSDAILDGLWRALGPILGGFGGQVGGQFGGQIVLKSIKNVMKNQMDFVINFLTDLGV